MIYDDPAEGNESQRPVFCFTQVWDRGHIRISSKIKHFQCHSLPDGIFQLINLVDRRQDEVRTVIAAVLLVRVNKINAKYLPQKYRMEETSILIYFVVKW